MLRGSVVRTVEHPTDSAKNNTMYNKSILLYVARTQIREGNVPILGAVSTDRGKGSSCLDAVRERNYCSMSPRGRCSPCVLK